MSTLQISARIAAVASIIALGGCGTSMLSSRGSNPVIQDFAFKWSTASSLSTTASRRLALMVYKKDENGHERVITCAEPPPDVGETFAKAIAAQLEVSAPSAAGNVKVGGGLSEQMATAIAPLMARTQGLQILRDSAYTLCVDFMNGWIPDSETYMRIKQERFDRAVTLIEKELPALAARAGTLKAPDLPASAPLLPKPGNAATTDTANSLPATNKPRS